MTANSRGTVLIVFVAVMQLASQQAGAEQNATLWDLQKLGTPPATEVADQFDTDACRAVFFAGEPWQGKPTKVFACYGLPEGASRDARVPGVVCVHGGGGTAFSEWVQLWNKQGFAAIALDTNGAVPQSINEDPDKFRHEWAGPPRYGFDQSDWAPQDQWPYHAVAAIIRAHSMLRSFPEVEPSKIGITGISWGGYLTSLTAGVDPRFQFAVPVYGCGFLDEGSTWTDAIHKYGRDRWIGWWDPSSYLARATLETLWVNGTNDPHYSMPLFQKTYRLPSGPRHLAIRVRMDHGHGSGWAPPEIYAFAKAAVGAGDPLVQIADQGSDGPHAWVRYQTAGDRNIASAELNYTTDAGGWTERKWSIIPARLDRQRSRAEIELPSGTTVYYFNLLDDRDLIVSSEHVEVGSDN